MGNLKQGGPGRYYRCLLPNCKMGGRPQVSGAANLSTKSGRVGRQISCQSCAAASGQSARRMTMAPPSNASMSAFGLPPAPFLEPGVPSGMNMGLAPPPSGNPALGNPEMLRLQARFAAQVVAQQERAHIDAIKRACRRFMQDKGNRPNPKNANHVQIIARECNQNDSMRGVENLAFFSVKN